MYKGHTVDKCYRVQGYPPGYQSRRAIAASKNRKQSAGSAHMLQSAETTASIPDFFSSLSGSQYTQLMNLMSSHMSNYKANPIIAMAHVTGQGHIDEDWQG